MNDSELQEDIGNKGKKLAAENIPESEKIFFALKGDFGQAIIVTEKAAYIIKWGFQTGFTFGGRCTAFAFRNISTVQIQKKLTSSILEIITPGNQDKNLSYWASRGKGNSAIEAPNAVTFPGKKFDKFSRLTSYIKDQITNQHEGLASHNDSIDKLHKLAELKEKGILTEDEFQREKKKLLN